MGTQTTTPDVNELLSRAADLKRELVVFTQGPPFARRLEAKLLEAVDDDGYLDDPGAILVIDRFALQHRLPDGGTVVDRFVAQRRPALADDERDMLLGWRDVIESCFEVREFDGDAVLLHNLVDDLVYRVYSTMGRAGFGPLQAGMFFVGRIVPLHLASGAWLVTGTYAPHPASARLQVAAAAAEQLNRDPGMLSRNPVLLQRAWEIQAEHRADFIDQVGADMTVLPPDEAQTMLREHYRRQRSGAAGPELTEDLLSADSIALIYDEVEGLTIYRDFGRLDALFTSSAPAGAQLALLRSYLKDDSVSPLAIRRLVQRHPDGVDRVFRALLRKPGFTWAQDGEQLLRRHKKAFLDREPTPSVSTVGTRLAELLRATAH